VENIALYEEVIWENETRFDEIKRKYVKWILGLDTKLYSGEVDKEEGIETESHKKSNEIQGNRRKGSSNRT